MKSFTGKFSSVRGWALLLALLLGAGMMVSACGDEETPTPTTPAPPPPPPPPAPTPPPAPEPTPEPTGPATPENLRVTATTSTSLTWSWNAVEDAIGYQGQFSTDNVFTETDPTFIIVAPATSHTVSNLSGNMTGHFRVRSGTGTSLTDLTYSEWTDGVSGTTAAPPPATALAAPANVESTDRTEDSITLEWDSVDSADTYEVEQREPGDDWSDASCGADDADNVVDDEECVASGLDEGTDYDFRVRGVPADDDDAHLVGAWSDVAETRTAGTAAPEPTAPTPGGMGELNVTWESTGTSITWIWERSGEGRYDFVVPAAVTTYDDAENPCEEADWTAGTDGSAQTSHAITTGLAVGNVRLLCVRPDGDGNEDDVSFAWAVVTPGAATATQTTGVTLNDDMTVASAMTWTTMSLVAGFDWETKLVADSQRQPEFDVTQAAVRTGNDMQAACADGRAVESGDTDVPFVLDEVAVRSGLTEYTGYALCLRFSNATGQTTWAVPDAKLFTHPGRPARPTIDSARSNDTSFVWQVSTRNANNVPRISGTSPAGRFEVRAIHYDTTFDDPDDTTQPIRQLTTATPSVKDCEDRTAPTGKGTWKTDATLGTIGTNSAGIVLRVGPITANTGADADTRGRDQRVFVCVRAVDGADRNGPWQISAGSTVRGVPGT